MVTRECLAILNAISLPVVLMDGEGRIKVANAHALALLKGELPKSIASLVATDLSSFLKAVRRNRHCAHLTTRLVEPLADYYPASSRVCRDDEWQDCYLIELFPRDLAVGGMSRLSETRRREASLQRNYVRARETARVALSQANQDPLTGIANRRAFDHWLEQLCRESRDNAFPFSLLLIDLDFFKRINDTHGHEAGDKVLCAVASLLTASLVRKGDQVARIGGEEFAVLLPNTDRRGAEDVAWRLVMALRSANKQAQSAGEVSDWVPVTLSIGAASWLPGQPLSSSALMREADEALYLAKGQGRDQAVLLKTAD
ncbi:diguanylate cyclase [Alcanivorax sp. S6407]|uniref:sensor domain-containing diguanylate cyclase n=1 Tax=Alcanivorax sp. S6407 TaxID=2926424 RepID=UPI001FF2DFFF|nr:sensor domain-containing diguanylate cyclase [Alcanivorax sp. S6407]MCK0154679.1 diguanylate cyclase [Alcanivorax sp. S6407]